MRDQKPNVMESEYFLMRMLKPYFSVDDYLIGRKLCAMLLSPFLILRRRRDRSNASRHVSRDFPLLSPDLFIPLIGLLTYVLLASFLAVRPETDPYEIASRKILKSILTLGVEVMVMKLAFSFYVERPTLWFDLLSWCGYKYVLICFCIMARKLVKFQRLLRVVLAWCWTCVALFTSRLMQHSCATKVEQGSLRPSFFTLMGGVQAFMSFLYYKWAFFNLPIQS